MADDLDPFGRRKDENPLAALGWEGDETASTVAPQPEPTPKPEPERPAVSARPAEPPGATRPPPQRGPPAATAHASSAEAERVEALLRSQLMRGAGFGIGRLVRAVIIIVVLFIVLGGVIGALVGEGVERADDFTREFGSPDSQIPAVPGSDERSPSGRAQATAPGRGLSITSLLRPAAFGKAMTRLRTGGYGRLTNLRVAPERIDASMLTKDGRLRQVQVAPGGAVRVIATSPSGFAGARTMTMQGIERNAPSRLTRSAAGRLKQPAGRVDYLVLSEFAGTRQWNVYFKGGQIFSADSHGRITRRITRSAGFLDWKACRPKTRSAAPSRASSTPSCTARSSSSAWSARSTSRQAETFTSRSR